MKTLKFSISVVLLLSFIWICCCN